MSVRDHVHYQGTSTVLLCNSPTEKENNEKALVRTTVKSMVTCWRCIMRLLGRPFPTPPETPEHDKLKAAKGPRGDDTQLVGEFLAWLDAQGIRLMRYDDGEPYEIGSAGLLEEFFDIDSNVLSAEKDALLDYQRKFNAAKEWAEKDGREALSRP